MGGSHHSRGLGPVWDDFLEEVSLGTGLGVVAVLEEVSIWGPGIVGVWIGS